MLTALLAIGTLTVGAQWARSRMPSVPVSFEVPVRGDPVEGERLAAIVGCTGCHGSDLGGLEACYEEPGRFSLTCPNVIAARDRYDDRARVALLRFGRKLDGAIVDFMPWDMFSQLSDKDLGHILAYIRSAPHVVMRDLEPSWYSLAVRWEMVRGRYLAGIACPECHAPSLRGYPNDDAPSLVVAKAYSLDAFSRLMRDGTTLSGTDSKTGLMSAVARERFRHLRPDEVEALKAYLDQRDP